MAFITNLADCHKNRTMKPRYARTQATPQAVKLNASVTGTVMPGMVLSRKSDGSVVVCDGSLAPAGFAGTHTDELKFTNARDFAMWVLSEDAIFAITAPAFDTEANWTTALTALDSAGVCYLACDENGLLTPESSPTVPTSATCARLIGMEGATTILIAGCNPAISGATGPTGPTGESGATGESGQE